MNETFSILSTVLLLFFILDPFGNVPVLLTLLKDVEMGRRYRIIIREVLIGLVILLFFLFLGDNFLEIFHLETASVTIAGGVIFLIIGLKMIFPDPKGAPLFSTDEEPLIVPIALPMIAGPSALATLILLSHNYPGEEKNLLISLLIAWALSTVIFLISPMLYRILKDKGLKALERLMGMLLLIMSVQMFIDGVKAAFGI